MGALPVRRAIRLLHTADVHIGNDAVRPVAGDHHDDCVCPIRSIAVAAAHADVDLIVIAGDLFDHGRIAAESVVRAVRHLAQIERPILLLPGNHDVYEADGLFRRFRHCLDAAGIVLIDEVDGMTGSLLDGAVTFWGRAMEAHTPQFSPIGSAPARPDDDAWHLVVGHGLFLGDDPTGAQDNQRSSPITAEQLAAVDADYVALGHVHVDRDLSRNGTTIFYPGAPIERREPGTVRIVDLSTDGVTSEARRVSIDAAGCRNLS